MSASSRSTSPRCSTAASRPVSRPGGARDPRRTSVVPTLLRAADGTTFRWSLYYEPEAQGDPSVSQLHDDLTYIQNHYGNDPSFLRIDGRPVVFVYADASDGCGMASRWAQANTMNAYVVLKVFPGTRRAPISRPSWHQYGPASATSDMAPYSYTISPGFWKKGESTPRLTRDVSRWQNQVAAMASSTAQFQLITTFNEWGEGHGGRVGHGVGLRLGLREFLDVLHGLPVDPSPDADLELPVADLDSSASRHADEHQLEPAAHDEPRSSSSTMENKERSSVVGASSAPYQNALRAQGIDFTHAYGVSASEPAQLPGARERGDRRQTRHRHDLGRRAVGVADGVEPAAERPASPGRL
jgi:hypothetical protein